MAMLPIIEGLTKTKKAKDDSSEDGDAPAEVPSVATPTLVGKDYALNAQEGTKLPESKGILEELSKLSPEKLKEL
jgi:hypothetical protein